MEYTFNGSEGKPIDLKTARQWTENYQKQYPDGIKAHFFGKDILLRILSEQGCMGIRMYYALSGEGEEKLILVGADSTGENLLPRNEGDESNLLADYSLPCPRYCPPSGVGL